ncbi:MAG: hypothetical protein QXH34_07095, partial [Ignisphaera sp.]
TVKGFDPRLITELREVKIIKVSEDELYGAYHRLVRKGFKIKPIAALSYYVANIVGNSVAVVTMGYKTRARTSGRESSIKRYILEVLSRKPMLTAYQIWREKPLWTLRAVYKAIKSMEFKREICFEIKTVGLRKIKYYRLC